MASTSGAERRRQIGDGRRDWIDSGVAEQCFLRPFFGRWTVDFYDAAIDDGLGVLRSNKVQATLYRSVAGRHRMTRQNFVSVFKHFDSFN